MASEPVSDFLDEMTRASRARAAALAPRAGELRALAERSAAPLPLVLGDLGVIAEIKPRAPSAGTLGAADASAGPERALAYADGLAACVSVLTEPTRFDGSLELLAAVSRALRDRGVPTMRKDFLVDPTQLAEARIAGASGVLLVVRMLSDGQLAELVDAARSLRLFALIEAFDEADLERAARTIERTPTGVFLGVNCRDLVTLAIDRTRLGALARALPPNVEAVAESGIASEIDVRAAVRAGYRGVLVGTALMRSADPGRAVRALRDAGRAEARSCT